VPLLTFGSCFVTLHAISIVSSFDRPIFLKQLHSQYQGKTKNVFFFQYFCKLYECLCVWYMGELRRLKKNNQKQFLFIQNQKHEIKIVEKFAANTKRDRCAHHKIRTWDRIWIDDRKIFKLHNEKHKHSLPSISYTTRTYREIKSARRYRSLTLFCSSINIMLFFFPR
jgi:hypothetical protein